MPIRAERSSSRPRRPPRGRRGWWSAAALVALLALPADAGAVERPFAIGFADPLYTGVDAAARVEAFDGAVDVGAAHVRIGVGWSSVAANRPASPTLASDPEYRFDKLDGAVIEASERGLIPILTVQSAPGWAQEPGRPSWAHSGSWKPDPSDLADLATALATRYDGTYPDPDEPSQPLPRVGYYEVWNEPNLSRFLAPQSVDGELFAPHHYRRMVNAFHGAVRRAAPGVRVLAGAVSPHGDGSPSFITGEPIPPSSWGSEPTR